MARLSTSLKQKACPVKLFVSYSHENSVWFSKLRPLLKFRNPSSEVAHVWHDQQLEAGHRWDDEIKVALNEMNVFVCLVSYEFLASDYIMTVELKEALLREEKKEVAIVPILLYPVNLDNDCPELKPFNPLPTWAKCWRDFETGGGQHQDAHKLIRDGLWEAIKRVRASS
ncbi:MAG: toll/interleukin-1 receptor domain-containing protein [Pirellulales bacterium]